MDERDHLQQPDEGGEFISLDPETEAVEEAEAGALAKLGGAAVPVVVVHLFLIGLVLQAIFGFELPSFIPGDRLVAWLWVNGGALTLAAWLWRKGRIPLGGGRWLRGPRARRGLLLWLGLSLAWFLLPALVEAISDRPRGW